MKNKKVIFIITIIFLIVCGLIGYISYINSPPVKAQRQLNLGNKYLAELDYEQAIVAYEAAIEIEPMNIDAYLGLIEAHIGLGDWNSALEIALKGYENTHNEELKVKADEIQAELDRIAEEHARAEEEERRKQAEVEWRSQYDLIVEADNGWHCFVNREYTEEERQALSNVINACKNNDAMSILDSGIWSSLTAEDPSVYSGVLFENYALELLVAEHDSFKQCDGNIYNLNDGELGYSFWLNLNKENSLSLYYMMQVPCVGGIYNGEFKGVMKREQDDFNSWNLYGHVQDGLIIDGIVTDKWHEGCEYERIRITNGLIEEYITSVDHDFREHLFTGFERDETAIGDKAALESGRICPLLAEDLYCRGKVFTQKELDEMFN